MEMAELGHQTVEFSAVVTRAAEESYAALKDMVERSTTNSSSMADGLGEKSSDSEKKIDLLKYILKTRQRMLRLLVLAKWCQQVPLVQYCQQLGATLSSHDTCFTQAADSLFFIHEGLQQARAPVYDVPSAVEVLLTGTYQRLPKCIEDLGIQSALSEDQKGPAVKKLDTVLRSKLLEIQLPKEFSDIRVSDGMVILRVDGEFKVLLTVGYRGHMTLWRILHLELLVGEKNGPVKLEETRRHALGDDLERRMAASENPFMLLYSILHELCVALVMDTVIRQVQTLRQGRWRDAIRFELITDGNLGAGGNASNVQLGQDAEVEAAGLKTPGVKIIYWLNVERNVGGSDSSSSPYIKIEPRQDLQIKCLHSSFVIDSATGKEAEFSLDQSNINVEKLLLKSIACSRHTRLLEIQRELGKTGQISRTVGDVVLRCHGDEPNADTRKKEIKWNAEEYEDGEVLCVRAYGSSYISLGINIRNGRFHLQASQNILTPSSLLECEEALNQGGMSAADVFISLRSKSILHLFASVGRILGLKSAIFGDRNTICPTEKSSPILDKLEIEDQVYEQGLSAVKIPKLILTGSDLLLIGFPDCGSSYYLLMQLDKDFKPLFKLLETQPDPGGKSHSLGDSNHVIRFNKIDINQMLMIEDELNLSLLNWEKLNSSLSEIGGSNRTAEHGLPSFGVEASLQPQSSFPSIVDEVFEFEKGTPAPPTTIPNLASSTYNMSLSHPVQSNLQATKAGINSSRWEGGFQQSQINNLTKVSTSGPIVNSPSYVSNNFRGLLHPGSANSFPSSPARNSAVQKLVTSKSDQELTSLRSPARSVDVDCSSMDDEQARMLHGSPKEACSIGQKQEPDIYHASEHDEIIKHNKNSRKRGLSDVLMLIPSLQGVEASIQTRKRRKISEVVHSQVVPQAPCSSLVTCKTEGYTYGGVLAEANHGHAPSSIYITTLLHVIRHCSLCIKHAQLTSQMDALDIQYVEEVGLQSPSSKLWFRLPFARDDSWQHICLRLGRPGNTFWDVKVSDQHFRDLWELHKGCSGTRWGSGVRIANSSDIDSHIHYDSEGVTLTYRTIEPDSIQKLVSDLRRLSNARLFALGIRKLLGVRTNDKVEDGKINFDSKMQSMAKGVGEAADKMSEQMRRTFKIEAVGLMSLWFSYGSMPVMAHFVVEWEAGKEGCTMHVSPDQLWPHTKFLEDFINGGDVASFLDCIRLTAGPLLALGAAIRPARMPGPVSSSIQNVTAGGPTPVYKSPNIMPSQGQLPGGSSSNVNQSASAVASTGNAAGGSAVGHLASQGLHTAAMLSAAGRGGPGIVPSSLLPIDVSVVLRGPYWIRIIYRKNFAVDMRCFGGDQVWLQPATPPKGGPSAGGSLPCPQFRPFIMEHVAQGLNALEPNFASGAHTLGLSNTGSPVPNSGTQPQMSNGTRANVATSAGMSRPAAIVGSQGGGGNLSRVGNAMLASSSLAAVSSGLPLRIAPGTGVPVHVRGELNTAFIGLGDDGGYGGGWVPLAALKKVLRGILKYLGVLWLFAQLPDLLREILGSILKENEGTLLNLDQEQPALRFFVGGYVFAVSVHRVQLLLQVLSVKRFHQQQQQQQQQGQTNTQEELTLAEINEICEYFSRRVASEPYDASRVASFITLLTLPITSLREFLKLIAWKKGLAQAHGDIAPGQRARIELCLENHTGLGSDGNSENSSSSKSNIHHDRAHSLVDFALTVVLDSAHIPHINAAGGAAWLPYCVSVKLRYSFGENPHVSLLGMEGSHGGQACWLRLEDWEKCRQRVARAVEHANGTSAGDPSQGRLRIVAEHLQRTLQLALQQLRDGSVTATT
ncbi:Mediator of RNA polymerase II transcription subunit 14 [Acorus calamus]|uniref:Mediator of RNA polymerase II transcription subunit 14 n=1 Tax=Acorus calamus TaxID=4465 RepID=A0AAV9EM96_ACOCL|nr:Mediator of RNA polymerase II transcription subunit 14 [Acorus calamus]